MSRRRSIPLFIVLLVIVALVGTATPAGAAVPPNFVDELVATVGGPTALAFTPDGRLLITTQGGTVRVFQNGSLVATPALNLGATGANVLCSNSERGLLGIAVDPQFATNGFVYLYYTFRKGGTCPTNVATNPVNRVSRFLMSGNTISFASELVLIDNIHSFAGNHNAGDLNFGKDGNLYVSVGDGGCDYTGASGCAGSNGIARTRNHLLGKILRITKDGGIPAGNPYTGAGSARCNVTGSTVPGGICQETYSWGLRNPFRMAFDPNAAGTLFHINDVGQNVWEEIDVGAAGADFGWNIREGHCVTGSSTNCPIPPVGMINPIFDYDHSGGCASITGGAFVPTNAGWPAPYPGSYLFADFVCGKIFRLVNNGGVYSSQDFATGLGSSSAVHMLFGPAATGQALYYTTYASGGQVRRIRFTAANTPPTADLTASPTSGPAPLTVTLNGSGSFDPEGTPLTYQWNFGDGNSTSTSTATIQHTYAAGSYTASLTVVDGGGSSSQADTVQIQAGNSAPTASITSPAAGTLFTVGQTITLTGSATDPQDGTLPASSLTWTVLRHHQAGTPTAHTHPWFGPTTGNNLTFQAPAPEDLAATTNSFLEVILTARDSGGLTTTVTRNVMPKTVSITFATDPTGRIIRVNGTQMTVPTTITSWQGYVLNIIVPKQPPWKWVSWSHGATKNHSITTPAVATTYTATFTTGGGGCGRNC